MPIINTKPIKQVQPKHAAQSESYYNTKWWKELRQKYIIEHPLCENCLANGRVTVATDVHHKQFFLSGQYDRDKWKLLLSESNLMSLCPDCHKKFHAYAKEHRLNYLDHLKT